MCFYVQDAIKWPGDECGVQSGAQQLRSNAENPEERDHSDQMSGKYNVGGKNQAGLS